MTNKEIKYGDSGEAKNKEIIRVDSPEGFIVEAVKGRVSVVGLEPRQEPVDSVKVGLKRGKGKNDPRKRLIYFLQK